MTEQSQRRGKMLVAIGPSPSSRHLVEWVDESAKALGCEWIALHVDSGQAISRKDSESLEANLELARSRGAEVLCQESPDIAGTIVEIAKREGAQSIVVGRSGLSRLGFLPRRPTVSDRVVMQAAPLDVSVVQDVERIPVAMPGDWLKSKFASRPTEILILLVSFLGVTGIGYLVRSFIGYRTIALAYLAVVLALALFARPLLVALFAVLSALTLNFLFMEPSFTFRITALEDIALFVSYFLIAFTTGGLVARLRIKENISAAREWRNAFLLASTQRLAEALSVEAAAQAAAGVGRRFIGGRFLVFFESEGRLKAFEESGECGDLSEGLSRAAQDCVWANSPRTYSVEGSTSRFRLLPSMASGTAVGCIAFAPPADRVWKKADESLIVSLGRNFAFIVQKERSEHAARRAELAIESDRLSKILLDSVSHEIRTPLTTITGSLSALKAEKLAGSREARGILVDGALEAADRLNRIIEDILSMSRIDSGNLKLSLALVDLEELVEEGRVLARPEIDGHELVVDLPQDPPPVRLDFGLCARLIANLLRNAALYSPAGSPVELSLRLSERRLEIQVRDHGPGVAEAELGPLFERFRRGPGVHANGLGLGLAICQGIVEAHGGSIEAHNDQGGGLAVWASFPECIDKEGL